MIVLVDQRLGYPNELNNLAHLVARHDPTRLSQPFKHLEDVNLLRRRQQLALCVGSPLDVLNHPLVSAQIHPVVVSPFLLNCAELLANLVNFERFLFLLAVLNLDGAALRRALYGRVLLEQDEFDLLLLKDGSIQIDSVDQLIQLIVIT